MTKKRLSVKGLFQSEASKLQEAVADVRRNIDKAREERDRIATAPLSRAEVEARLDQWLNLQAEGSRVTQFAREFTEPGRLEWSRSPFRVSAIGAGHQVSADVGPLLISLFREQIRAAILAELPEDEGIPMADRPARLAELDVRIGELEAEEEELIEGAEAIGIEIERRPDASPEVILGVEWTEEVAGS